MYFLALFIWSAKVSNSYLSNVYFSIAHADFSMLKYVSKKIANYTNFSAPNKPMFGDELSRYFTQYYRVHFDS